MPKIKLPNRELWLFQFVPSADTRIVPAKPTATHVINSRRTDLRQAVYDLLPDGPDIVFEAAGALPAAEAAFALCRRGTRVNMFGVIVPGTIPVSPADVHFQETRVDASFSVTPRVMTRALDLMRKGLVDPRRIITHHIPLTEMPRALEVMGSAERVKVVVCPGQCD